jgi:predicted nucleic acid-binding protein
LTRAVLDSSVIIALSHLKHLQTIDGLFKETIIPRAVYEEICVKGKG